jgi:hypothetical protein
LIRLIVISLRIVGPEPQTFRLEVLQHAFRTGNGIENRYLRSAPKPDQAEL